MSADYYIDGENINWTYNLGPMLRAAGFPAWKALEGAPAVEAGGVVRKVADTLRADPEKFRVFNPPNGWGTYETCLESCDQFVAACAAAPRAVVKAWL